MVEESKRLVTVQSLRALAISAVFVSHLSFLKNSIGGSLFNFAGAAGVSIFFVLSGYLAMYRYRPKQKALGMLGAIKGAGRKSRKFYPLHLITLLMAVPIMASSASGPIAFLSKLFPNLLLLQSWIPSSAYYFSFNTPSWYLSTYVFLLAMSPLALSCAERLFRNRRNVLLVASLGIFMIFVVEVILASLPFSFGLLHWLAYVCPPARLLDYLAGILLAILLNSMPKEKLASASAPLFLFSLLAFAGLVAYTVLDPVPHILFYSAVWLIPSAMTLSACLGADMKHASLWKWAPIVLFGNISMELFMIHWLVINYAQKLFDLSATPVLSVALLFVVSLLFSATLHVAAKSGPGAKTVRP